MLQNRNPPNVPVAPQQYDATYLNRLSNVLRLFFNEINAVQALNLAGLNLALETLPTEADFDNLRLGDVFRDTTNTDIPGSNLLRVKTSTDTIYATGVPALGSIGAVGIGNSVALTGAVASGEVGTVTP